jgi:hypothetical protein
LRTEIEGGRFEIRTDRPGVKVSWQVTGIRKDPYANAHRIVVETDKSSELRGAYVYPKATERRKATASAVGRAPTG